MLKIVSVPNDILTKPTKPVSKIDGEIKELIDEMAETLNAQIDPQGVGLAAPQVGVNLSLFVVKPNPDGRVQVFINPKILQIIEKKPKIAKKNNRGRMQLEGCLSIVRIWSPIERPKKILLEYQKVTGEKKTEWFTGFKATVIQHEVDHLNGILFTQRALEQQGQLYEEVDGKLKKMSY